MSLKAKIEAVIYAAEEPVTLSQIVGLLGREALADLDRIASAQSSLQLEEPPPPSEPDLLNDEIFFDGDAEQAEAAREEVSVRNLLSTDPATQEPEGSADIDGATDSRQNARDDKERATAVRDYVRQLLDELVRDYASPENGLEIREVAGGYRLATKPEYHDAVRGFVRSLKPPLKLSLQALETLAVVAYKQPVTVPEVSEIRGVDSGGVLGSLMARKLVTTAGRKQVIGRPILYRTTKDFLLRFGLKDIHELPSIEEFEKMAGELAESEPVQEEIPMAEHMSAKSLHADPEFARGNESLEGSINRANLEEEKNATEPQADGDGATVDTVTPDGRLSGILPPAKDAADPSAAEADIQQQEQSESQE